jgi:hypothetical protein
MFGLPAAFYVDDDTRRREAVSLRASLASKNNNDNNAQTARSSQGSVSLPASRIPSRATSRKPSLSGVGETEGEGEGEEAVSHLRTVSRRSPQWSKRSDLLKLFHPRSEHRRTMW